MPRRVSRFRVGKQRIPSATRPSEASYTRRIRSQMEAIERNITQIIADIEGATEEAIEFGLQPIYDKSQVYVPVDTGKLKASGFIRVRKAARGLFGEVSYAKAGNPHYAVFVHELLENYHKPPTQAKFLEAAVNENIDRIGPRIVAYLKKELV